MSGEHLNAPMPQLSQCAHKDKYKLQLDGNDLLHYSREIANKLNGICIFMTHSIYGRNLNSQFFSMQSRPFAWLQRAIAKCCSFVNFRRFIVNCDTRSHLSWISNIDDKARSESECRVCDIFGDGDSIYAATLRNYIILGIIFITFENEIG